MTDHKIVVTHVRPPIPNGDHYTAYSDRLGADCSPYGFGETEQAAIDDLILQLEDTE